MTPSFLKLLKVLFIAGLVTAGLASCASTPAEVPYTGMEAPFISDATPLRNSRTTDLNRLASTLPIYHSGDSKTWVRTKSAEEGEWLTRVGDPTTPVRIKRLPSGPSGAQRIEVMVGPSKASKENPPPIWIYELERASGGWKQIF